MVCAWNTNHTAETPTFPVCAVWEKSLNQTIQHFPFKHTKFEFIKQTSVTVPASGTLAMNNFSIEFKKCRKQALLEKK